MPVALAVEVEADEGAEDPGGLDAARAPSSSCRSARSRSSWRRRGCRRCRSRSRRARRPPDRRRGRGRASRPAQVRIIGGGSSLRLDKPVPGMPNRPPEAKGRTAGRREACVMERRWTAELRWRDGSRPATGARWRGRSRWSKSTRADHRAAARALLDALGTPPRPALAGRADRDAGRRQVELHREPRADADRRRRRGWRCWRSIPPRRGRAARSSATRPGWSGWRAAPAAFIRPSPSQAALGGVGRRTRETIRLVEAWGAGRGAGRDGRRRAVGDDGRGDDRRLRAPDRAGRRRRAAGGQARHHGDGGPDPRQQGGRSARARGGQRPAPTMRARCGCCGRGPATRRGGRGP